jgi:ribonuclease P protein component
LARASTPAAQERFLHEANISAEPHSPEADARLQDPHEHEGGSHRAEAEASEGPQTAGADDQLEVALLAPSSRLSLPADSTQPARGSQRLRRVDRLHTSREYARSRSSGRRLASGAFSVELSRGRNRGRLGLVVSRRVGGAVVRNRLKRVIREWFRRSRETLSPNLDVVVVARPAAAALDTREAWRELSALVAKAPR